MQTRKAAVWDLPPHPPTTLPPPRPPSVADIDLSQPVVGSDRPTLLYMTASCGRERTNCGKFMRSIAAEAFADSGDDVKVPAFG
jgi:hypothetical protein